MIRSSRIRGFPAPSRPLPGLLAVEAFRAADSHRESGHAVGASGRSYSNWVARRTGGRGRDGCPRGEFGEERFPLRYQTKLSTAFHVGLGEAAIELVDFGLRWYEPRLGRFLNRDPLGQAGGNNLYAYLGNRAFGAWDAWGWSSRHQDGGSAGWQDARKFFNGYLELHADRWVDHDAFMRRFGHLASRTGELTIVVLGQRLLRDDSPSGVAGLGLALEMAASRNAADPSTPEAAGTEQTPPLESGISDAERQRICETFLDEEKYRNIYKSTTTQPRESREYGLFAPTTRPLGGDEETVIQPENGLIAGPRYRHEGGPIPYSMFDPRTGEWRATERRPHVEGPRFSYPTFGTIVIRAYHSHPEMLPSRGRVDAFSNLAKPGLSDADVYGLALGTASLVVAFDSRRTAYWAWRPHELGMSAVVKGAVSFAKLREYLRCDEFK